uniref:Uncharacterized protein n=1 Tax=Romanomermis culicivorax TaxID=13658 RepID=A0A915L4L0_ROMCU
MVSQTMGEVMMRRVRLVVNYVFPAEFDQRECHVSSIINGNGEIPVICYCMGWLNEYTINGDKCFQGELVIQSNVMWDNFIAPTKYDIYPFDVCANIRRNRPLHCEQCRYIDHHTRSMQSTGDVCSKKERSFDVVTPQHLKS